MKKLVRNGLVQKCIDTVPVYRSKEHPVPQSVSGADPGDGDLWWGRCK